MSSISNLISLPTVPSARREIAALNAAPSGEASAFSGNASTQLSTSFPDNFAASRAITSCSSRAAACSGEYCLLERSGSRVEFSKVGRLTICPSKALFWPLVSPGLYPLVPGLCTCIRKLVSPVTLSKRARNASLSKLVPPALGFSLRTIFLAFKTFLMRVISFNPSASDSSQNFLAAASCIKAVTDCSVGSDRNNSNWPVLSSRHTVARSA